MTADVRNLLRFAAVLASNAATASAQVSAVVERGALNVKNGWRENARATSGRHARLYPASISYDVTAVPGGARAEIGPDKGAPQGPLGNLLEFGSSNNPPHNDGGRALAAEDAQFTAHMTAIADPLGG